MFKKTTKTDKDLALTSRNEWIRTNVNSKESLMVFLSSLMDSSSKYLVMGRSPISLITPLFGSQNRKDCHFVYNIFRETKLTIESRGIRIWFRSSINAKRILRVLAAMFRVSPVKMTNDTTFVYSAIVSIGEPSIEVFTDITLENKVKELLEKIEIQRSNVRLYDNKITNLRAEQTALNEQLNRQHNSRFFHMGEIRKLEENIRELRGV